MELIQRIASRFQDVLSASQQALEQLETPADTEYIWNIQGYAALLDHANALIEATQDRLLIAIGRQEAGALAELLARAEARGVAITTLCLDECPEECGGCRGTICRSCAVRAAEQHWIILVSDEAEMLAGEIDTLDDVLAVRTRQRLQVDLASWYIRHSMALTVVLRELNKRPDQVLGVETRALLQSVDLHNRQGGWLDHLRVLVRRDAS